MIGLGRVYLTFMEGVAGFRAVEQSVGFPPHDSPEQRTSQFLDMTHDKLCFFFFFFVLLTSSERQTFARM